MESEFLIIIVPEKVIKNIMAFILHKDKFYLIKSELLL